MREPGLPDAFRRDLDRIELPAEAMWVPERRRRSLSGPVIAVAGAAAIIVAAVTGGLALRRDDDVAAPVSATASPPAGTHGRFPIHDTANAAGWATGHMPTDTILLLLARTGVTARASPAAPAKVLLFNATDLELIAVDDRALVGFVVYRYRDAAAAAAAYQLPTVQEPTRGTISWAAKPRFVLIGDALVNYATNDDVVHERVARALMYPDLATVPPAVCAEERERWIAASSVVLRADRVAAKRMTLADLAAGGGNAQGIQPGVDPNTFVCVVAVAGELRAPFGGVIAVPTYPWGVFVAGAGGEAIGSTHMDRAGSWPSYFDALPNRVPDPLPGTIAELVNATTIRVKLDSAVLSQEFGNPALFRADRHTELTPPARDLGSMGLRTGDRVLVFFQPERRDSAEGGYVLAKLAFVPSTAAPRASP